MQTNESVAGTITLTTEEINFLAQVMGIVSIPGFSIQQVSTDNPLFEIGKRSLLGKEFLALSPQGEVQLNPTVVSIIGMCASPDKLVSLTMQITNGKNEQLFYYQSDDVYLRKAEPYDGISVIHFGNTKDMGEAKGLEYISTLPTGILSSYKQILTRETFNNLQQLIANGESDEAKVQLKQLQWGDDEVTSFVSTMKEPTSSLIAQVIYEFGFEHKQKVLWVISDTHNNWFISADSLKAPILAVSPLSGSELEAEFTTTFAPLSS